MIEEFRASFTEDLAKPSRFDVLITPLAVASELNNILDAKTLSFRCESASLPGRSFNLADLKIYGPVERFPTQSTYEDITLTFICTSGMAEKVFFNKWMDIINPLDSWNFKYKNEYVADIFIRQYSITGDEVHVVKLVDAFPTSVQALNLDWSNTDGYHKLAVSFAYTYWEKPQAAGGNLADSIGTNVPLDGQGIANIPSLLNPNQNTQKQGTYLDITNQSIGPFDTVKDQYASAVNIKNAVK